MKLNHINLAVTDVLATSQFLKKYFGMRNMPGEEDDSKFNVLFDDDQLVLIDKLFKHHTKVRIMMAVKQRTREGRVRQVRLKRVS